MRILVTGSAGNIGQLLTQTLLEAGHEIRTFDRAAQKANEAWEHHPGDLRDINAVRHAVQGMDAVAHLGAIPGDRRGGGDEVLSVNAQGTWNVMIACAEADVKRVVNFSSINALGCVGGHREAVYLPIDDAYPRHPLSPYQLSKHLGEDICRSFSEKTGIVTICLRPGYVASPSHYHWFREADRPFFITRQKHEYWAYVDIRDVCDAVILSLNVENVLHDAFLLEADDNTVPTTTAELVDEHYPHTPWKRDRDAYLAGNPHRSLVDCSHAKRVLGWQPKRSWRDDEPAEK